MGVVGSGMESKPLSASGDISRAMSWEGSSFAGGNVEMGV
jgi:hypothetical protein